MSIEFEIKFLVLCSDQLCLRRILDGQHLCANSFDIVTQLTLAETIGRKRIDNAEDIAELVIETRPQDTLRQRPLYVGDLLANLIPDIRDSALRRAV
jgi:hypothetical protein